MQPAFVSGVKLDSERVSIEAEQLHSFELRANGGQPFIKIKERRDGLRGDWLTEIVRII